MELELYGADDKFYSKLDQEDALLGSYPVDDGCRIHVRPPFHSFIQQILAVLALCENQDRPYSYGAPSPPWRKKDLSPDSDSQSGPDWARDTWRGS